MTPPRSLKQLSTLVFWLVLLSLLLRGARHISQDTSANRPRAPDSIIVSGNDSVSIRANKRGQFVANGAINGERIRFLVDTGATLVTVSSAQARRLRLTPGKPITVNTAAGEAKAFLTRLSSVQLGGITLQGVNATIVPSYESEVALLGMSFLRHLSTENANGVMILKTLPPTRQ